MKKRIELYDLIKAVAILLVVFCHTSLLPKQTVIGNFIMSAAWVAVPCFMMVSGALMIPSSSFSWQKYAARLGKTYLVMCAWRLIYFIVDMALYDLSFSLGKVIQYLFFFTDLKGINTGVMWYMIAYLVVMLLYPVIWHLYRSDEGKRVLVFMMAVAFVSGIIIPSADWLFGVLTSNLKMSAFSISRLSRIMPFNNYANMISFFIAGVFVKDHQKELQKRISAMASFVLFLLSVSGLMVIKYTETSSFQWGGVYLSEGYNHLLTFTAAIALWLSLADFEERFPKAAHFLARNVGVYTMGIYYMHYIILEVVRVELLPLWNIDYSVAVNSMKTLLITSICIFMTWMLRKLPMIRTLVQ